MIIVFVKLENQDNLFKFFKKMLTIYFALRIYPLCHINTVSIWQNVMALFLYMSLLLLHHNNSAVSLKMKIICSNSPKRYSLFTSCLPLIPCSVSILWPCWKNVIAPFLSILLLLLLHCRIYIASSKMWIICSNSLKDAFQLKTFKLILFYPISQLFLVDNLEGVLR